MENMAKGRKLVEESDSNAPAAKKSAPEPTSPEAQIVSPKRFVLKHIFKKVYSMAEGEYQSGQIEDHFGLNLSISMGCRNGVLEFQLEERKARRKWHLDFDVRCTALGMKKYDLTGNRSMEDPPFQSLGWKNLENWKILSRFFRDGVLPVECEIQINGMKKIGKKVLRSFDASMEEVSDIVLVVRNQKFYVSKYTLSAHSEFFKALILGSYKEAHMPEIILYGVDPFDLQNYLEFLYLQPSICDETVEGLLLLSDQFITAILREKCEEFLLKDSKKSLKKKFKMFLKYNCTMEKIIKEIRTYEAYQEVIAGENIDQMHPRLKSQLQRKSASFSR